MVHPPPLTDARGAGGERLVALAMHFTPLNSHDSDTIRLQSVLANTRVQHVCGVGETNGGAQAGNMDLNFKSTVIPLVAALANCNPTIGVLDYFWLETHYYEERYGMGWPGKLRILFKGLPGLRHFILPMDRLSGELALDFKIKHASAPSFDFPGTNGLHCYLLTPKEGRTCNPLVVATMLVKKELLGLKGVHASESRFDEAQQKLYLARDRPFLLVSRSATRKEALSQLRAVCSTPAPAPDIPHVAHRLATREYVLER